MLLHAGAPLAPHDLWTAWTLAPALSLPVAATGAVYALGVRRLWRGAGPGRGVSRRQATWFALGWLALALTLLSPLHPLGEVLFSAHMAQHELLMVVAAPLLVLGQPGPALAWGLPRAWRPAIGTVAHARPIAALQRRLTAPLHAWWVHVAALALWHLSGPYQASLRSDVVHAAQHASFLGSALLFWWALLRTRRLGRGAAVAYLFGASIATGVLGALLTFSTRLWYPAYAATTAPWGLSALDDQRLGGMIMWMPGGLSYMLAGLWLFSGWLREPSPARGLAPLAHPVTPLP